MISRLNSVAPNKCGLFYALPLWNLQILESKCRSRDSVLLFKPMLHYADTLLAPLMIHSTQHTKCLERMTQQGELDQFSYSANVFFLTIWSSHTLFSALHIHTLITQCEIHKIGAQVIFFAKSVCFFFLPKSPISKLSKIAFGHHPVVADISQTIIEPWN